MLFAAAWNPLGIDIPPRNFHIQLLTRVLSLHQRFGSTGWLCYWETDLLEDVGKNLLGNLGTIQKSYKLPVLLVSQGPSPSTNSPVAILFQLLCKPTKGKNTHPIQSLLFPWKVSKIPWAILVYSYLSLPPFYLYSHVHFHSSPAVSPWKTLPPLVLAAYW